MKRHAQVNFIKMGQSAADYNRRLKVLIDAAGEAADWLCDAHEGSDQRERGEKLRLAIQNMRVRVPEAPL